MFESLKYHMNTHDMANVAAAGCSPMLDGGPELKSLANPAIDQSVLMLGGLEIGGPQWMVKHNNIL